MGSFCLSLEGRPCSLCWTNLHNPDLGGSVGTAQGKMVTVIRQLKGQTLAKMPFYGHFSQVVRTLHFQCWEPRFNPWLENYNPISISYVSWQKKKKRCAMQRYSIKTKCIKKENQKDTWSYFKVSSDNSNIRSLKEQCSTSKMGSKWRRGATQGACLKCWKWAQGWGFCWSYGYWAPGKHNQSPSISGGRDWRREEVLSKDELAGVWDKNRKGNTESPCQVMLTSPISSAWTLDTP